VIAIDAQKTPRVRYVFAAEVDAGHPKSFSLQGVFQLLDEASKGARVSSTEILDAAGTLDRRLAGVRFSAADADAEFDQRLAIGRRRQQMLILRELSTRLWSALLFLSDDHVRLDVLRSSSICS